MAIKRSVKWYRDGVRQAVRDFEDELCELYMEKEYIELEDIHRIADKLLSEGSDD